MDGSEDHSRNGWRSHLRRFWPIALIVLSLLPSRHSWYPIDEPVDLGLPGRSETSFRGKDGALYAIGIEVDADPESYELVRCLLQTYPPRSNGPCADIDPELDATWSLRADGQLVASGSTDDPPRGGEGGGGRTSRTLTCVCPAARGVTYTFTLDVRTPAPQLAEMNPSVVASINGAHRLGLLGIFGVPAFLVGLVGLIARVPAFILGKWARRSR